MAIHPRSQLLVTLIVLQVSFWPAAATGAEEYSNPIAYKLLSREAYRAAARRFGLDHEASPELAGPLAGLALCRCRQEAYDEARTRMEASEALGCCQPLQLQARACLAEADGDLVNLELHRLDEVGVSYSPSAVSQLGAFYSQQGRFEEALEVAEVMKSEGLRGRVSSALEARCLLGLGDVDAAALIGIELGEESRGRHPGRAIRTLVALSEDALVAEEVLAFRGHAQRTRNVDSMLVLGAEGLRRLGRLDEAETQVGRRKKDPDEPLSWAFIVRIQTDLGDLDGAERVLQETQRRWPCHPSVLLSEALLCTARGEFERAARALELARAAGVPAWDRDVEQELEDRLQQM